MASRNAARFYATSVTENEIYRYLTTHSTHQDQLLYSRVQTMLIIEGVAIAAVTAAKGATMGMVTLVLATVLAVVFWLLARRDRQAQVAYVGLLDKVHRPLGIGLIPPPKGWQLRGFAGVTVICICILVANIAIAFLSLQKGATQQVPCAESASEAGRYQMVAVAGHAFILDTATGRAWEKLGSEGSLDPASGLGRVAVEQPAPHPGGLSDAGAGTRPVGSELGGPRGNQAPPPTAR